MARDLDPSFGLARDVHDLVDHVLGSAALVLDIVRGVAVGHGLDGDYGYGSESAHLVLVDQIDFGKIVGAAGVGVDGVTHQALGEFRNPIGHILRNHPNRDHRGCVGQTSYKSFAE